MNRDLVFYLYQQVSAGSSRGTHIKTTKGPSAPASSDSESKCLDKSPIEEADKQISSESTF